MKSWQKLKESGTKDNVISDVLGVSRATFYRYQKAYKSNRLLGLKPKSTRSKNVRQIKKRTLENISLIRQIREANPTYGKAKIAVIMRRDENVQISESTVLKHLIDKGMIKRAVAIRPKRRIFKGHAQKWNIKADRSEPGRMIRRPT